MHLLAMQSGAGFHPERGCPQCRIGFAYCLAVQNRLHFGDVRHVFGMDNARRVKICNMIDEKRGKRIASVE